MDLKKWDDSSAASAASGTCNLTSSSLGYQDTIDLQQWSKRRGVTASYVEILSVTTEKESHSAAIARVNEN
jgi:hypothetical protein